MSITRDLFLHTTFIQRSDGSTNASGDVLSADDARWSVSSKIDCRLLSVDPSGRSGDGQQADETGGKNQQTSYQVYAPLNADIIFGDRLTTLAVKATGGTVGGTVWGTPYTVLDDGPLHVIGVGEFIDRSVKVKVLEVEKVV